MLKWATILAFFLINILFHHISAAHRLERVVTSVKSLSAQICFTDKWRVCWLESVAIEVVSDLIEVVGIGA